MLKPPLGIFWEKNCYFHTCTVAQKILELVEDVGTYRFCPRGAPIGKINLKIASNLYKQLL